MATRPLNLLLVEDVTDDADLVTHELRRSGFESVCERVETADQMRTSLCKRLPSLIISDYSLPQFDGLSALELRNELAQAIPFILVSGAVGEDRAVEVMKAGAQDYIRKNNLQRLGIAVEKALDWARLHRQAEETSQKRRDAETLFRALFDNSLELVYLHDFDGGFIDANDRALSIFGLGRDQINGLRFGDLLADAIDLKRAYQSARHIYQTGTDNGIHEYAVRGPGGNTIWIEVTGTRVDKNNQPYAVLGTGRDITDRKQLQAQLAQADRLSNMGMLAAGVAHEINNPLSYVLYNLESIVEELPDLMADMRTYQARLNDRFGSDVIGEVVGEAARGMNPTFLTDIRKCFQSALEGTRQIRQITKGLGTFSRVEDDEVVPVDLKHVIEAAINICYNEIKYRARIIKEYGKLPMILASEGRLSQVFLNLLINATHAIDEGDTDNNEIRIRTWSEEDTVCAEVRDSGRGIDPAHLTRLFEPFFSTKEIGVGSGLGLPISKGIVEGYGGTIAVESQLNQGTSFFIRIPVRGKQEVSKPKNVEPQDTDQIRGKILIIDDEDAIRDIMSQILCSHHIVQAATGAQAKEILKQDQAFDVIICDLMMPKVSGMDLHSWLMEEYSQLAQKVVFITGGAFTPRANEYLRRVDNLRLEKPFDVPNFRKIISTLIRDARKPQSLFD